MFPSKSTLPTVFSSHLGGYSILLAAQTRNLGLPDCHIPTSNLSGNPVGSMFKIYIEPYQHSTSLLLISLTCINHWGSPSSLTYLFKWITSDCCFSLHSLLSKQQSEVIHLKRYVRSYHSPASKPSHGASFHTHKKSSVTVKDCKIVPCPSLCDCISSYFPLAPPLLVALISPCYPMNTSSIPPPPRSCTACSHCLFC